MKNLISVIILLLAFNRLVSDVIFSDDFENSSDWILSGEFQINRPYGLGGEHGNSDPASAFEGDKILGVDLIGLGDYPGDYEPNLADREYYAISPEIDCSQYSDIHLSFMNWLGVEQPAYDHAYIDISNDGGLSWLTIWQNDATISNNDWNEENYDISQAADLKSSVMIRFSIGETDASWQYCGWNIDNFKLEGTPVQYGALAGFVLDATQGGIIENAMISSQYSFAFSDSSGHFLLTGLPEGSVDVTVSALGYETLIQNDIPIFANDITLTDFSLIHAQNLPPAPQNLSAELYNHNNVHLMWSPPEASSHYFIAYNVYKNGIIIQSVVDTVFDDTNLVIGTYNYFVTALYDSGSSGASNSVEITVISSDANQDIIPADDEITMRNYPNPFNPTTTISYELPQNTKKADIGIYNIKGQRIRKLKANSKNSGIHQVIWNGKDDNAENVASGVYFYKLNIDGKTVAVRKCVLMK